MKRKICFVCSACSFYCPEAIVCEFEDIYDVPASDAGLEHVSCKECVYNSGICKDCLFLGCPECPEGLK